MQKTMGKTLAEIAKLPRRADKVEALRKADQPALRAMLCMIFDPEVKFEDMSIEKLEYKPTEVQFDLETVLYHEMRRMYLFLKAPNKVFGDQSNPNVPKERREQLFIQLLEVLPPEDCELMLGALKKKLPFNGLNPKLINDAFPGLLSNG